VALSGKERQTEALRASTLLATGTANYWIAQGHGFVRRRWLGASQLLARRFSRLVDRLALTACFKHTSATTRGTSAASLASWAGRLSSGFSKASFRTDFPFAVTSTTVTFASGVTIRANVSFHLKASNRFSDSRPIVWRGQDGLQPRTPISGRHRDWSRLGGRNRNGRLTITCARNYEKNSFTVGSFVSRRGVAGTILQSMAR